MFSRNGLRKLLPIAILACGITQFFCPLTLSAESSPMIYGVYNALNMGNPGEISMRDFYINLGSKNGVKVGAKLDVLRKLSTHDLISRQLQKDMLFAIAELKVIHVEDNAAIARLEKVLDSDSTPVIVPRAVMVGDMVRVSGH